MQVKYYGRDPVSGTMRVSRKALTVGSASAVKQLRRGTKTGSTSKSQAETEEQASTTDAFYSNHIVKAKRR